MLDTNSIGSKTEQYHQLVCKRERLKKKLNQPMVKLDQILTIKKIADVSQEIDKVQRLIDNVRNQLN